MQADFVDAGGPRLFVRRWGGGSEEWPPFSPALEAAGYSAYAPDAPGVRRIAPDELRARAHARFPAAVPNAEIVAVPASHGIFTEAGEEVRRALLDWLAENGLY